MRDLDKRAILVNDFIVVYGDVVSNIPLGPVLQAHRARRAIDKNAIMTMVLREAGIRHRTKANDFLAAFVIDSKRRRCLHYQQLTPASEGLLLDEDALAQDVDSRTDLVDCGIDICTPEVLALWSDNFDYENPRSGFLHSVLKDYELNGKTIHTHIVKDGYAARVRNLQAYDAVSQDVLDGWASPYTPATGWADNVPRLRQDASVVIQEGVNVSRTARLEAGVAIGKNSIVGKTTTLRQSTVGRDCVVGNNCIIRNGYIWDDVIIEDDCEVRKSIIASGARVAKGSKIYDGALVSYNVHLPPQTILGKRKRAVVKGVAQSTSAENGFDLLASDTENEDAASTLTDSFYNLDVLSSRESTSTLASDVSENDADGPLHRASFASQGSVDSRTDAPADAFVTVNAASILDSLKQGHDVSTIQLELQSQRMAQNATEHQVRQAVANGLCRYLFEGEKKGKQLMQLIQQMKSMFERIVFDASQARKDDQVDFLLLCQAETGEKTGGEEVFGNICNGLYTVDDWDQDGVFTSEAFEQWWEDERSQKSDELRRVRSRLEKFIVIVTADDDEDDGDDSDEDSDT